MNRIKAKGAVVVYKNGEKVYSGSNVVVTAGFELYASIIGASGTKPSHMAFGDDNSATTISMTALQGTEHERVALDSTTVVNASITYTATFGSGLGAGQICKEIGIFNAASAGAMLCRFITQTFTINPSDSVVVEWTVSIGE